MSNDYTTAWDALGDAIGSAQGSSSGSISEMDHLTVDQRLKAVEIAALLAIAQEISDLNPNNSYTLDDGQKVNAWGFRIP